jgi:hypothetical protein
MGVGETFGEAFVKSQIAAGVKLPRGGRAFISVRDGDKVAAVGIARDLGELGFALLATRGTAKVLASHGIAVTPVNKVAEGRPPHRGHDQERRRELHRQHGGGFAHRGLGLARDPHHGAREARHLLQPPWRAPRRPAPG